MRPHVVKYSLWNSIYSEEGNVLLCQELLLYLDLCSRRFEEESEHSYLLLNTSDISLGLSILSCVHLCNFSKVMG